MAAQRSYEFINLEFKCCVQNYFLKSEGRWVSGRQVSLSIEWMQEIFILCIAFIIYIYVLI